MTISTPKTVSESSNIGKESLKTGKSGKEMNVAAGVVVDTPQVFVSPSSPQFQRANNNLKSELTNLEEVPEMETPEKKRDRMMVNGNHLSNMEEDENGYTSLDDYIGDEDNIDAYAEEVAEVGSGGMMGPRSDSRENLSKIMMRMPESKKGSEVEGERSILKRSRVAGASADCINEKQVAEKIFQCFRLVDDEQHIEKKVFLRELAESGILPDDPRLRDMMKKFDQIEKDVLSREEFVTIILPEIQLIQKVMTGNVILPEFKSLCTEVREIVEVTRSCDDGDVARYIPQLARVDPAYYGVAICSTDGQRYKYGDSNVQFCVQSTCKPINYCLACEEHGPDYVHNYVGRGPSGKSFNAITLNNDGKPHNPLINAGAIMTCSMVQPKMDLSDRFDYVTSMWEKLSGGCRPGFSNATYLSERMTADRNFALAYYMRKQNGFPSGTDLTQVLEFYFQCCSIEMTAEGMANVAGTLANGGICPITGERVISPSTVRNCLSLMYSCGMYDYSGEFAFTIGLPAKSGVAGAIMIVIPNVMGICTWSPKLDSHGNSARGIEFCKHLCKRFNFHNYDGLMNVVSLGKRDPRVRQESEKQHNLVAMCFAASQGDLSAIRRLVKNKADLNAKDYDGRSPLHLACAEGHTHVVAYFIKHGADVNAVDRWKCTPLDDGIRESRNKCVMLLKKNGGLTGIELRQRNGEEITADEAHSCNGESVYAGGIKAMAKKSLISASSSIDGGVAEELTLRELPITTSKLKL
eukprot:Nk52_evm18s262 gene=Nk52_evmTU18s262